VYDLETSRMGVPYIYDISRLRVNIIIIRHPGMLYKDVGVRDIFHPSEFFTTLFQKILLIYFDILFCCYVNRYLLDQL
jgi:hypothetical protein